MNVHLLTEFTDFMMNANVDIVSSFGRFFTECFNFLPVAAIIDEKIFCMHGGLSPELTSME